MGIQSNKDNDGFTDIYSKSNRVLHPKRRCVGNWQTRVTQTHLPYGRGGSNPLFGTKTGYCNPNLTNSFYHKEDVGSTPT